MEPAIKKYIEKRGSQNCFGRWSHFLLKGFGKMVLPSEVALFSNIWKHVSSIMGWDTERKKERNTLIIKRSCSSLA